MRMARLGVITCGSLALGAWAFSPPSQAAMGIAPTKAQNMSLIEPMVAKGELSKRMKKGVRYTCTDWGITHCCTSAEHSFCVDELK